MGIQNHITGGDDRILAVVYMGVGFGADGVEGYGPGSADSYAGLAANAHPDGGRRRDSVDIDFGNFQLVVDLLEHIGGAVPGFQYPA